MKWGKFDIIEEEWSCGEEYDLNLVYPPSISVHTDALYVGVQAPILVDGEEDYVVMGVKLIDLIKNFIGPFYLEERLSDPFDEEAPEDLEIAIRDLEEAVRLLSGLRK